MNIFVITPIFPNEFNSQSGIFVFEQCKALMKRGHNVVVLEVRSLSPKKWRKKSFKKIDIQIKENITIYSINLRGIAQSYFPRWYIKSYNKKLSKLFSLAKMDFGMPDVLYAHFTFPSGYCGLMLSENFNIPLVVLEHHSFFIRKKVSGYIKKILTKTVKNSNSFICVSNFLAQSVQRITNLKRDIQVIPNLVDDKFKFYDLPSSHEFTFFSAGNLIKSKRFDLLINSFCHAFSSEMKNIQLVIAGFGKEYNNLKKIIERKNRNHQISLLGRLNRDEMLNYFIKCNCFILLSIYETFGIVYREALSVGRPIISTNNGGIKDNWQEEYGIIVSNDSIEDIEIAMKNIYKNYHKYNLQLISQKCLSINSSSAVAVSIENILNNAINK